MFINDGMTASPPLDEDEVTIGLSGSEEGEGTIAIPAMQQRMLTISLREEFNGRSRVLESAILKSLVIGHDKECDVVLADRAVSRKHCKMTLDGTELYLEDTGSRNGTFVNDQPVIGKVPLKGGDKIRLGMTILTLTSTRRS